jgi:hypothetical protein
MISSLPVTSSKQRLAQSEIAKKVSCLSTSFPMLNYLNHAETNPF